MIVKLKKFKNLKKTQYGWSLSKKPDRLHYVLGISDDSYRIINDMREPIIYPMRMFDIVDNTIPKNWKRRYGEDKELYTAPPILEQPGFYEDYFDDILKVRRQFWDYFDSNVPRNFYCDKSHVKPGAVTVMLKSSCEIKFLSHNRLYYILGIENDEYRIISDLRDPVLVDMNCFDIIDNEIQKDWVTVFYTKKTCTYPKCIIEEKTIENYNHLMQSLENFWNYIDSNPKIPFWGFVDI
ncbi:MAG: hypothetical protein ACIAQZ_05030 [Sedimentisphaeraceae bacterium JB056]